MERLIIEKKKRDEEEKNKEEHLIVGINKDSVAKRKNDSEWNIVVGRKS